VGGQKGLVPYNYIKVLGKRRGQPSASVSMPALPAANPQGDASSLSSAFSQASVNPGNAPAAQFSRSLSTSNLPSSSTSMNSSTSSAQNAQPAVGEMDSAFRASLPVGDGQCVPEGNQNGADMSAADILDQATGD
jgi:hypothetical protein